MATYLDTDGWSRREAFEYFRGFDKPYFSVCVRLDVAPLKAYLAQAGVGSFSLACHFLTLRIANLQPPFRLRLQGGRVRVYERIGGSATVLRDDDSFSFAYFDDAPDYAQFCLGASAAIAASRSGRAPFDPKLDEAAVIHFTTLPWLHFSSFSHARNWGQEDSIPKIAFGRTDADGARWWLPCSVEVHHALMDGLQLGRYVQALEAALAAPDQWLGTAR